MSPRIFKRLRYYLRLGLALAGKYYLILGIGALLGCFTFFISPHLIKRLPKWRGSTSQAIVGRYTTSDIPLFIQSQLSVGLTTLDPQGLPSPAIATSWEITDDGKTYTFTLDPNLMWQDKTPLKSSDINYQFRDTTTEYTSDHTLVIKLTDPYAPLPVVVSRPVFKRGLLGTGSYKVGRVKRNGPIIDSLTLVPTDPLSTSPNIVYHFFATEAAARLAFKLGTVRSIADLQDIGDLANWANTSVATEVHPDRYVAVFFNTKDDFFAGTAGRNLRLALAYAIDKSRWPDRAYGPVNPNSWAYLDDLKTYDLDLVRANQLLDQVDVIPETITLSTVPAYLSVAEGVKEDWEKLGVEVEIIVSAEPTDQFQALVIAQAIPTDPDQYNLWHSTQVTNLTQLSSPRIDKLLEDGRKTLDLANRKVIYQNFQRYLVDEAPAIFLFHPQSYTISRN